MRALRYIAAHSEDLRARVVKAGAPVSILEAEMTATSAASAAADAAAAKLLAEEMLVKVWATRCEDVSM